ncbi:hypothetical protein BJ878DRAFT_442265 [Calycina marina]|uniref:Integral membrane protein-like protein n=1 Tax=Calycina marina TaxID=1763456 RepID=A0A9P7Z235_9HELO|nr:hypothetical protein BJ878DRAFT_442265 [Calycina marina]
MKTPFVLFILPLIFITLAFFRAQRVYSRDPTSYFFDSTTAYDRKYSLIRKKEADAFIEAVATKPFRRTIPYLPGTTRPLLCIGIPTVSRPTGDVYVRTTIGSLLAGLNSAERDQIYLVPFIAHSDPDIHPIYNETWLRNVADEILTYHKEGSELQHLKDLEKDKENREKQISDYTLVLEACIKANSEYVVTFEDDVLALDGWFHRTKAALQGVQAEVKRKNMDAFFYIRLFYTETSLGWNLESWPYYVFNSVMIGTAVVLAVLIYMNRYQKISSLSGVKRRLHYFFIAIAYTAIAIGFFFLCGRVSMFPISNGVEEMNKYACCAQGLVYNQARVPRLIEWYREKHLGYVDVLAESLGDTGTVGSRWALTPSVVQHVGTFSTKGEDKLKKGEVSVSQQRWNFAFELNDASMLKIEHEAAIRAQQPKN